MTRVPEPVKARSVGTAAGGRANSLDAERDEAIRCAAPLEWIGETAILRLPSAASAQLPSRGQVAASGSINGQAFATVIEPDGRRGHWLKLAPGLVSALTDGREGAGGAGESGGSTHVEVVLVPAREWPEPDLPDDFAAALTAAPAIAPLWQAITPMARWEWVRWINATRNPQTRARRVAVAISKLDAGTRRPCCFDLSACTDPELSRSGVLVGAGSAEAPG